MTNEITGNFTWHKPEIITSFVEGEPALPLYESIKPFIQRGVDYDEQLKLMTGSNTFIAARIDTQLQKLGLRTANFRDLSRPELRKITNSYLVDAPALALTDMNDSHEKNRPLIQRIAEIVKDRNGRVQLPLLVTGFDVALWPEDKEGYGITIVPREDFSALYDERLKPENTRKTFSKVDEIGFPEFNKNGDMTWYVRPGLSRVCADGLVLNADDERLALSDSGCRVVVVGAEGAQNFFAEYRNNLRKQTEAQKALFDERFEKASRYIETGKL